jgi:hypothetical protein
MDGGDMPTREEWLKEQEVKNGASKERRPPSRQPHILQGKK